MAMTMEDLAKELLTLSSKGRATLADRLVESLAPPKIWKFVRLGFMKPDTAWKNCGPAK